MGLKRNRMTANIQVSTLHSALLLVCEERENYFVRRIRGVVAMHRRSAQSGTSLTTLQTTFVGASARHHTTSTAQPPPTSSPNVSSATARPKRCFPAGYRVAVHLTGVL